MSSAYYILPGKETSQTEKLKSTCATCAIRGHSAKAALGLLVDPAHQRVLRPEDLMLGTKDSTKD